MCSTCTAAPYLATKDTTSVSARFRLITNRRKRNSSASANTRAHWFLNCFPKNFPNALLRPVL